MIHFFGGYYTIVALALLVEPPCTQLAVKTKNTVLEQTFRCPGCVCRISVPFLSILIQNSTEIYGV